MSLLSEIYVRNIKGSDVYHRVPFKKKKDSSALNSVDDYPIPYSKKKYAEILVLRENSIYMVHASGAFLTHVYTKDSTKT